MKIENFIVSSQVWEKLEKFKICSLDKSKLNRYEQAIYSDSNRIGKFIEDICELYLNANNFEVMKLEHRRMQKVKGDFFVTNALCESKFIECKSSHINKGIDKVALDYKLYKKYTNEPYIPMNADKWENKGYLHYCEADILFCVNVVSGKIYIVLDFQKLKHELLEMIQEYSDKEIENMTGIESSYKYDSNKKSKVYHVDFKQLHKLGIDVLEYDIKCDIMDLDNEKNTQSLVAESVS